MEGVPVGVFEGVFVLEGVGVLERVRVVVGVPVGVPVLVGVPVPVPVGVGVLDSVLAHEIPCISLYSSIKLCPFRFSFIN